MQLAPAGQVLRGQEAGREQPKEAAQDLEFRMEIRDLIGQFAHEAAGREVLRMDPPLAADAAVFVRDIAEQLGHRSIGQSPSAPR